MTPAVSQTPVAAVVLLVASDTASLEAELQTVAELPDVVKIAGSSVRYLPSMGRQRTWENSREAASAEARRAHLAQLQQQYPADEMFA